MALACGLPGGCPAAGSLCQVQGPQERWLLSVQAAACGEQGCHAGALLLPSLCLSSGWPLPKLP